MVGGRETPLPLRRIGGHEVGRILGRGATASVYECRHVEHRRPVAVKVLHPHLARDPIATQRFTREACALSRLVHPNVVQVLDVGDDNGVPFFVMSLVEGNDLTDHIRLFHPMTTAQIADCILPVIDAVTAAHDAGIVHRDLKPSNIRLARGPFGTLVPKVLDFGISKLTGGDEATDLTESGTAVGTVGYMSPEQLRSSRQVDARSDIYALG
ncbi:MAG: serine/threonine protein kinase, partial [Myxococcota bacterium]|nr:serine/threonine protein kinase [Myxococcota bacterium]